MAEDYVPTSNLELIRQSGSKIKMLQKEVAYWEEKAGALRRERNMLARKVSNLRLLAAGLFFLLGCAAVTWALR